MSEAVLPPKKSKAAREAPQENGHESDVSVEAVNVFKITVVEGKRERKVPADIQKLTEWINEHLEEKEGVTFKLLDVYNAYLEASETAGGAGVEQTLFYKTVKDQFPKGFGIKEGSSYHGVIKERKKRPKSDKPKAPSLQLKMKDIVARIIQELGNPKKGIRFQTLKMHIAAKYPALRVDVRPQVLKNTLARGAYYGSVEQVKGVGAAGYYRLPGPELNPDGTEKIEEPKPKDEVKDDVEKLKEAGDKEENDKEGSSKEKEGEGSEAEKKEDKEEKPKTKKRKKKPYVPRERTIIHGAPERIEDTFLLAMTYMCEPKEASSRAIKKYILDHYKDGLTSDRFKKALNDGEEKGFWECVRGDGLSGSFQLTIEDFDPTDDKDMYGMIVNAITACNEPKQCSSRALKTYIADYHPNFNIVEKPHLFKKALERACKKEEIIQISGIGSTGSFQMAKAFSPNPVVLAGQDTASDYEGVPSSDDEYDTEDETTEYAQGFSIKQFQDAYTPRATKRRGKQRAAASKKIETLQYDNQPRKRKTHSSSKKRKVTKKSKTVFRDTSDESSSEEESSSEDNSEVEPVRAEKYVPRQTKSGRGGRAPVKTKAQTKAKPAPRGRARKQAAKSSSEEEASSDEEVIAKPKARGKATPKGRGSKKAAEQISEDGASSEEEVLPKQKAKGKATPKGKGSRRAAEKNSEEEASSEEEVVPKKKAKGKATPKGRGSRKAAEDSSEEKASSEEEVVPKKKARGKATPKGRGSRKAAEDSSEEEASSEEEVRTKSKSRDRATPKGRGQKKAAQLSSGEESGSEEEVKSKGRGRPAPKGKGSKKAAKSSSEDEQEEPSSEEEVPPPKKSRGTPTKAATPKGRGKGRGAPASKRKPAAESSDEEDVVVVASEGEVSEEEAPAPKGRDRGKSTPKRKSTGKGRKGRK